LLITHTAAHWSPDTRSLDESLLSEAQCQAGKLVTELEVPGMPDMMVCPAINLRPMEYCAALVTRSIGTCKACLKGWNQMCENQVINGITKGGGCK
jgi:hypothetical protein